MDIDSKDIKVPIKTIIEESMKKNSVAYEEDVIILLRRYFIACLNLGFLQVDNLKTIVDKFTSKISNINNNYSYINKLDYYFISSSSLYICGKLLEWSEEKYVMNFYKAVTEVIFDSNDEHIGFNCALCEMAAEKVFNMDVNNSRIIMSKTTEEIIGYEKIQIRAGYENYNLIISLLKQLLISKDCNENKLIYDMFHNCYNEVLKNFIDDETTLLLINVLDKLCIMYISRLVLLKTNVNEKYLLDKYQLLVNKLFNNISHEYFAFCALITSDELRRICMAVFEKEC